jgi:hypothetical protein
MVKMLTQGPARGDVGWGWPEGSGSTLPKKGLALTRQDKAALLKRQKQGCERTQQVAKGGTSPIHRYRVLEPVDAVTLQALGGSKFQAQLVLKPLTIEGIGRQNNQIIHLQG